MQIIIEVANKSHQQYAAIICDMMAEAAKIRGTGIAKRKPEYIRLKIEEGKAVIAVRGEQVVGFCYIESWDEEKYVANSGLIVHPDFRNTGLAQKIKAKTFDLSYKRYPNARLFGITTSMAVMKINSTLGYKPVTFSELTKDEKFWAGCQSCSNYDILMRTDKSMCLCTGMVCDFKTFSIEAQKENKKKAWERLINFMKIHKPVAFLKKFKKNEKQK